MRLLTLSYVIHVIRFKTPSESKYQKHHHGQICQEKFTGAKWDKDRYKASPPTFIKLVVEYSAMS
jgi:hypothetical protein